MGRTAGFPDISGLIAGMIKKELVLSRGFTDRPNRPDELLKCERNGVTVSMGQYPRDRSNVYLTFQYATPVRGYKWEPPAEVGKAGRNVPTEFKLPEQEAARRQIDERGGETIDGIFGALLSSPVVLDYGRRRQVTPVKGFQTPYILQFNHDPRKPIQQGLLKNYLVAAIEQVQGVISAGLDMFKRSGSTGYSGAGFSRAGYTRVG